MSLTKWDGETNIYSAFICHYIINYAFNHSNLHLFCIYVANFIKIYLAVSDIYVLKTWHLKCELSNRRVRAVCFLNHVPFPNNLRYNSIMFRLI